MASSRKVLVFIGPQGSGKGTQGAILADKYGFKVIVIGEVLREAAEDTTPLGREINSAIVRGDFVSDDLIIKLLVPALEKIPATTHILFDGFPRTPDQARALDKLINIDSVIHISLPHDVSVKRITGRLICPNNHSYNSYYVQPRHEGLCNIDNLPLKKRVDDTEEAVEHRLELYRTVTTQVLEYYNSQGKLISINGDASVFAVSHEIKTKVLNDIA